MSEVDRNVWMRGFSATLTASQRMSMSPGTALARPVTIRPFNRGEVVRGGSRETGLDDVDVQPSELMGKLDLLLGRQREAGRLLAVAERRVEDQNFFHRASLS
jgi:hypothetical protein